MNEEALQAYLEKCRSRVENSLSHWLPEQKIQPERLHAAMRFAALGAGKRIRPMLTYAAGESLGVASERLDGPACAVELIHTYSLVHDDLPAMDNDDLRRGRPTCHKQFDEATAILAGDALQTLAFKVLCRDKSLNVIPETRLLMIDNLAQASGSRGMAGGQAIDLASTGQQLNLTQLENMHIHKTGALIRASVRMGTLAASQANPEQLKGLDHYAKCIGLAFQVQDDILDIEGSTETLGKTQGKDRAANKPTYPSLLGLEQSREMAQNLCRQARDSLQGLDHKADPLRWLAEYIVSRSH